MMKTIVKILLAAIVLSLAPTTYVCAQGNIETPAERKAREAREAAAKKKPAKKKWKYQGAKNEGFISVQDANGKYGYIDKTGKVVIPCKWKDAGWFVGGSAFVIDDNGKRVMIDKTGKIIK